ncbi:MAG TPA: ORF6N domain-containing protein [Bacteroidales bacterium]|nr:ORF6N domain-containing protein [Bacteroidales bacterium]
MAKNDDRSSALEYSDESAATRIYCIRGRKVMLDFDLAILYQVSTKALKQAVRRNIDIFPDNFMIELSKEEFENLRSQTVTSSWGGTRYLPFAFSEYGILQLANVLRSDIARKMSIRIIEVFVKMREMINVQQEILKRIEMLDVKANGHDQQLALIFEYLDQLEKAKEIDSDYQNRKRIGFRTSLQDE